MKQPSNRVVLALKAVCQVIGTEWGEEAVALTLSQLARYPEQAVLKALERCAMEIRHKLVLKDIVDRLPGWHPGPEEAWSIVARALASEHLSVVWTRQMAVAYGVAIPLADDLVAARMAFKEAYEREVAQAQGAIPEWELSPGWDRASRDLAVLDAVEKGRLTVEQAKVLLPHHVGDEGLNARLLSMVERTAKKLKAA